MNRKFFLTFFILLTISCLENGLNAQNISFSDTILWYNHPFSIQIDNENNREFIIYSQKLVNNSSNFLPYYFHKCKIEHNKKIDKVEFFDVKYETIPDSLLSKVKNLNLISNELTSDSWVSIARGESFFNMNFIPLRKNPSNAKIERVISFSCNVILTIDNSKKSARYYAENSKLASGKWYKIRIKQSAVYKLSYSQLLSMGFSASDINSIGVFGYGKMLPKVIDDTYVDDLTEIPIHKVDVNSNGIFDEDDYFLFYADCHNEKIFSVTGNFSHIKHSYSDYSHYFVSNMGSQKQVQTVLSASNPNVDVTSFDEYQFLEVDSLNLLSSGRRWFWKSFDIYNTHKFSFSPNNIILADSVFLNVTMAMRSASNNSSFSLRCNNVNLPSTTGSPVNLSGSTYASLAIFNKKIEITSSPINIDITYNKPNTSSNAWLDFLSISYRVNLTMASKNFIVFRDTKSVSATNVAKYKIISDKAGLVVWDITDRQNIYAINGTYGNGNYNFSANANSLKEYLAFDPSANFDSPEITGSDDIGFIQNQNLHSHDNVDLIIISHPQFLAQANGFKSLHAQYDGMTSVIVTPEQIYNEFSSGTKDVSAIRNFVKMYYDNATSPEELPKNLLLLGDGSYNNRSSKNLIPTFQSIESLNSLSSTVSDDFYVILDEGEGELTISDEVDMGVGRITVRTVEESENYLNKVKAYYGKESNSDWKNNLLLAADDADNAGETVFQTTMNSISVFLSENYPEYNISHIYLDAYKQESSINGSRYPTAQLALNDIINKGVFVVAWLGHGNYRAWASEYFLDVNTITNWSNTNKYPIFLTATCDFAPFDMEEITSAGELILLNPKGGGVGLFTTTRKVFSSSGETYTNYFFQNLFLKDVDNEHYSLGESILRTKMMGTSVFNKFDFCILGDPAIKPPSPNKKVVTNSINSISAENFLDTIKSKMKVNIKGSITNPNGVLDSTFNGVLYPVVFDKFINYSTLGNDGQALMTYKSQNNILFRGQATIKKGLFSFDFVVPLDISYFYDYGKISYYASTITGSEAGGYYDDFVIGGTSDEVNNDNEGPKIEMFMNNENFFEGGITNEKPILIANLSDISGINTVGNGIGHDITLTIDGNNSNIISINDFYEATIDDYSTGKIRYRMPKLEIGPHTLKMKVWDIFNNSSEKETSFIVTSSDQMQIEHIFNYPNPFNNRTSFYITHNQPYVELKVLIQIFTVSGKLVKTLEQTEVSTGFQITPIVWDGLDDYGDKLAKGVYLYKIRVKNSNGESIEKYEKLMILN